MAGDAPAMPPGVPAALRGRLVEVARREWPVLDWADYGELSAFLAAHGLPVDDLSSHRGEARTGAGAAVGAAVLLAGQLPSGDPWRTAASPAPGVPGAAAVVYARQAGAPACAPPHPTGRIGPWRLSWTDADHAAAVRTVRSAIARGEVYQVNVVAHRSAPFAGAPAAVSERLAEVRGTPYSGALSGVGWSVHSASPEGLLEVEAGVVVTRPIKGTVPRSPDAAADRAARRSLEASVKDRAEHVMIVDLERNDLARVCRTGTVSVPELYGVRPLAGVWHAESTVRGVLRPGVGLAELLAATFPGGSVTGAPKIAAIDLIAAIEPVGRGPSMGALGWVGADGRISLGLSIRTFAVAAGALHLWTGGGITWGSDPQLEVAEAHAKAAPLLAALAPLAG